jgi:pantoate--beta-alanine ligase
MSSRNLRLGKAEREQAPPIYRTLQAATTLKNKMNVTELEQWVKEKIEEAPRLKTEYFRIVHADTFRPVTSWDDPGPKQGLVAVWAGNIRLIDNIEF